MTRTQRLSMAAAVALGLGGVAMADQSYDAVLKDAQSSTFLLAEAGPGAGYDSKGAFIRGDMGELRPSLQLQFRWVGNRRDESKNGTDTFDTGFEVRRMKLDVEGWVGTKDLTFNVVWGTERSGGEVVLEDAYARYMFADGIGIVAGQFKDPVFHEELTSSKRQIAVERSMLNEILGGGATDRVQGAGLVIKPKDMPINATVVYHDGAGSRNTNFQDNTGGFYNATAGAIQTDYFGVSGRVECMAMGGAKGWNAYKDFSAVGTTETLLVIAAGADWTQGVFSFSNNPAAAGSGGNRIWGTVDAQLELANPAIGAYAAFIVDYTDFNSDAGPDDKRTNWGFVVQGSYAFTPQFEGYARWSMVKFDDDFLAADAEDTKHEVTVGLNYYMLEKSIHRSKISVDVIFLPNGGASGLSGIGVLSGDDDQIVVRAQWQILL